MSSLIIHELNSEIDFLNASTCGFFTPSKTNKFASLFKLYRFELEKKSSLASELNKVVKSLDGTEREFLEKLNTTIKSDIENMEIEAATLRKTENLEMDQLDTHSNTSSTIKSLGRSAATISMWGAIGALLWKVLDITHSLGKELIIKYKPDRVVFENVGR
jgi:hypothetical protein